MTLLKLDDLEVSYKLPGRGSLKAVDSVSFDLEPRQVLGLVGESGCGKSTLARAVCGLEPASSGSISFNGRPVGKLGLRKRDPALMRIQMVFQNPFASLNPRRTIGSQIEDGLRVNPDRDAWSVPDLLEHVELDPASRSRFPHQFSGGQRQRVAIARAIAAGPELLIGDEPIASLDASLQARIAILMRNLAVETGAALLFISHDLSVVRVIADDVAVMSAGRIVERGPVDRVWSAPEHPYTQRLLAAIPVVDGLGVLPG
ncbi:ABC transporter ATP-binding protein [Agromyces albus]|uniref:ABC transporter ATP-binding protein n=1 Tax=Agromyces albus TaxID=205332 RepID=A0A4Q2L6R3_9MICO|nr:ATP-binding cassette domain-containing protein [Agromyces albus]RXZ73297.1 ABC transporter ATP-binding protein [Agromyces albus]